MPIKFANPEAEEYYKKGLTFETSEEWKEAAENYDLAAQADSAHPEVWYRLGEAWAHRQNEKGCGCDGYLAAMACEATTADEYYWRAKATEARSGCIYEDYDEEIAANYAAYVALEPNNAEAWFSYGNVFGNSDELRIHCYNQALTLDPTNTLYYYGRASFYHKIGRFDEALADYNVILANEPDNKDYYFYRGQLYHEHDHLAEAMADYNNNLAIEHSEYRAKERGKLRLLAHDFKGALKDFDLTKRNWFDWRGVHVGIKYPIPVKLAVDVRWEEAVQALERSRLIETTHPDYLKGKCEHHLEEHEYHHRYGDDESNIAAEPALLALDIAETLVASKPKQPSFRELRIACQLVQQTPDMAAVALDYEWLSQQPSLLPKKDKESIKWGNIYSEASLKRVKNLHKRVEYLHKLAWAQYSSGDYPGALASFAEAVGSPLQERYDKDLDYCADVDNFTAFLPPVPAEEYVLWQLGQQLLQNPTDMSTHLQIRSWLSVAIESLPWNVRQGLKPAFEKYQHTYLVAGSYFVKPRTAEQFTEALALCAKGAQEVPVIADIFKQMSLNILKGQLREAMNQAGATEASKEAALAHYDTARAEMLAKWQD